MQCVGPGLRQRGFIHHFDFAFTPPLLSIVSRAIVQWYCQKSVDHFGQTNTGNEGGTETASPFLLPPPFPLSLPPIPQHKSCHGVSFDGQLRGVF